MDHREFNLLRLHAIPGVRWRTIHRIFRILEERGETLEDFFQATQETWRKVFRLPGPVVEHLAHRSPEIDRLAFEWQVGLTPLRARVLSESHPAYPDRVRSFFETPPPILYWVGDCEAFPTHRWVSWVSSRTLTARGQRILSDLVDRIPKLPTSIGVVSSFYRPVYRRIARASLAAHRPTLLVPDRGFLQVRNSPLMKMRHEQTWIVSPFAPDDVGTGGSGPKRDQMLVALSDRVVGLEIRAGGVMERVLQQALQKSKTVWVYQPPYPTTSNEGNFHLLAQGARPFRDLQDLWGSLLAS